MNLYSYRAQGNRARLRRLMLERLELRQLFSVTPAPQIIYQTDFEQDDGGFTADNSGGAIPGLWHYSIGRYADGQTGHTPIHNWYYGVHESAVGGGTYVLPNQHLGVLSSPQIALPTCANLTGSFNYLLSTRPELNHDFVDVSIQYVDSSNQSRTVKLLSRADGTLPETNHQWRSASMDLTAYAGLNVRLLFTFDTGDRVPYDPEGWYVDDVLVMAQDNGSCPSADLSVTKTDGKVSAVPGEPITYTITVSNAGPNAVTSLKLTDTTVTEPAPITPALINPKYVPSSGAYDPVTQVWSGLNLGSGQSVTITLSGTINPSATGTLTNTVIIKTPSGTTDPNENNNTAVDEDQLTPVADLSVTKTDGKETARPGDTNVYTIIVSNTGPSTVNGFELIDSTTLLNPIYAPATGVYDPVTHLWTGLKLEPGQSVTITLTGTISLAASDILLNTVRVSPLSGTVDPDPKNNVAVDATLLQKIADLSVTKTDNKTTALPGATNAYTIVVTNAGPSTLTSLELIDSTTLLNPIFTPSTGVYDPVTHLWSGLNLGTGQSVTMTLTGTISPAASGILLNTVSVSPLSGIVDPDPKNNVAVDTTLIQAPADLSVTKTDNKTTALSGDTNVYTIVVTNAGPSTLTSLLLVDTTTPALVNPIYSPSVGQYDPGTQVWSGLSLAAGQSISMTLTGTISASEPVNLINKVTVAPPGGYFDPDPTNNVDEDATWIQFLADLSVTKTDGKAIALPGDTNVYTITVTNAGPGTVTSLELIDSTSPALINPVYLAGTGAYDPVTHIWSGVSLGSGQSITMTLTGVLPPTTTGVWINHVTVGTRDGVIDTNFANNEAIDTDALPRVDLSVTKTDNKDKALIGDTNVYTIIVNNAGPDTLTSLELIDSTTPELINPVYAPGTGVYNPVTHIWSGLSLAAGQSISMTLTGVLPTTSTGVWINQVTVSTRDGAIDTNPANNQATDTDALPRVDLSVTKTDGKNKALPGDTNVYTITVTNAGPDALSSLELIDSTTPELINPVYAPATGTYDPVTHNWSGLNLAAGQSISMTLTGVLRPTSTGVWINQVTVATRDGAIDTNAANNHAIDIDALPRVDLSVTKTNGKTSVAPGESIQYTITVSNSGPDAVTSVKLTDTSTPALLNPVFTPGIGQYDANTHLWTGLNLAIGQSVIMTFSGTLSATETAKVLTNTVTVAPANDAIDVDPTNNVFPDADAIVVTTPTKRADLRVEKTDNQTSVTAGDPINYTITVTNDGPDTITSLTLIDATNPALTNPIFTPSLGNYNATTHVWSNINLGSGQNITMMLSGIIDASAKGILVNTVTVSTPDGVTDPNVTNNSATDTNTINQTVQFISPQSFYRASGPLPTNGVLPAPISTPAPTPPAGKATIKGFKWNDLNQNGQWDLDQRELGRGGWEIYIDLNDNGIFDQPLEPSTTTGEDGSYAFTDLAPGSYIIRENTTLLSAGTFTIQRFPNDNKFTVEVESNKVFEGRKGIAEKPNFGGFEYSPFIRPADDILGHLRIAAIADRQALQAALAPWQSIEIPNGTDASIQITVDKSQIQSEDGRKLIKIVDTDLNEVPTTFQIPANSTKRLFIFFDPANDSVLTQFPSWFPGSNNGSFTFSQGDHLKFTINPQLSYRIDLVGASTQDGDILSDGVVQNLDALRLSELLSKSDKPIQPDNPLFDPLSDVNVRCPNGANDTAATCHWDLSGPPTREIWYGDFGPISAKLPDGLQNIGYVRSPFFDLDVHLSGVNKSIDMENGLTKLLDSNSRFANARLLSVAKMEFKIKNALAGDQLRVAESSVFNIQDNGSATLTITPQRTTADFGIQAWEDFVRNIVFTTSASTVPRIVEVQVTAFGSDDFTEQTGNVAMARIRIPANTLSILPATAEGERAIGAQIESLDSLQIPATQTTERQAASTHDPNTGLSAMANTKASNGFGVAVIDARQDSQSPNTSSILKEVAQHESLLNVHSSTVRIQTPLSESKRQQATPPAVHDDVFSSYAPDEFQTDFADAKQKRRLSNLRTI